MDGEVDPMRDLQTITDELQLKDLEYVRGVFEKVEKLYARGADKNKKTEFVLSPALLCLLLSLFTDSLCISLSLSNKRFTRYAR